MSNQLQEDLAARIAGLKPDARRAVYERARAALQAEVRASAPFMPVQTVVARRRELEKAILAVEREAERHDPPPPIAKPAPAPTPSAPLAEQKSARKPNDAPERTKASVVAPAQTQEPRSSPEWIPEAHGYEPVMTDRTTGGPNTLAQFADAMPPRGAGDPPSAAEPRADENKRGRQAPREHAVEGSADAGVQVSPLEHQDEDVVEEGYEEAFVEPPSRPRGAVYAGIVALTLCAAALAVVLVGFTSDVRPHAPREAAHLAAPMPLPSPSSSGARLIDSAGFQDAARDALREGETLLAQRDFAGAVAALDDAVRLDPGGAAAHATRALAHGQAGDLDASIRDYTSAIERDPQNAAYRLGRADGYGRAGKYAKAVDDLDRIIAADPRHAGALHKRCRNHALLEHFEEALADCDQALHLLPGEAAILDDRGFALLRLGRLEQAIADYTASLKRDPRRATSLYGRGIAKIGRGDRAGGQEDVAAARAIDPGIAATFAAYGLR